MNALLRLFAAILIIFYTIACTETTPKTNTISAESSIEFEQRGTLNARLFGSWSLPDVISSTASLSLTSTIEQNTSLAMMDNNRFISWGLSSNQVGNSFNLTEVFSKDINGLWINSSPLTSINQPPRPGKNLTLQHINGHIMAVWEESNSIYSSIFIPEFGWNAATLHGVGNRFHLSRTEDASLLLIWYLAEQNGSSIQAQHYDGQTGWGSPHTINSIGNIKLAVTKPTRLTNGNYLFVWINDLSAALTLQSIRLDPQNGWSAPVLVSGNYIADIEKIDVIAIGNNNAKLFIKTNYLSAIYGIYERDYQFNIAIDETWSAANLFVDPYQNPNPSSFLDFKIAVSPVNREFSFVWIGDSDDGINQYQVIQFKIFTMNGGWGEAQVLSTPLFRYALTALPADPDANPSLRSLVVNQSGPGQLNIAWLQVSDTNTQLKATQVSTSGIVENDEIITTLPTQETITNIKLSKNSTNESQMLWVQQKKDTTGDVFSLVGSSKTGIVSSQPIAFDPTLPKPTTHIATSDSCLLCHDETGAIVTIDHTQVNGTCIDCHNGIVALGQPSTHLTTADVCEACHSTLLWQPVILVDHAQVFGVCVDCHNGRVAIGKFSLHIPSSDACDACHVTAVFIPAITVDHNEVIGVCVMCHNGIVAPGKSNNHFPATDNCEACHSTSLFVPAIQVDHRETLGVCIDCHNGFVVIGKAANHIVTSDNCDACHSVNIWAPVVSVDHNQTIGACIDCHNGFVAIGKAANHIVTGDICDTCHSTNMWAPVVSVDHSQIIGACIDCHNGSVVIGKAANHIVTSDICDACHSANNWVPAVSVDHSQTIGSCDSCHSPAPITHTAVGVATACETCHSVTTWFNPINPLPSAPP